ncbi:MAG: LPS export ABC transporter ATP-binding protein [Pseudomonadales bacterium]|uniref:Lipopolysaccharide export system ATP-binding protein LptB n=1 Tax=marine metagenome TaxID=408172 RepID=A0A381S839_9ZZZZ|nr:LPS export ABC transporter ATP-binding protein [Pseudomonadales bacterium]MEC9240110.1 LPS export ABC transporter ATP-binding protein [Pseudomonadota bacterium]
MSILRAANLHKSYRGRPVVNDLSIHVSSGEIVGLLGPNGAGKTLSFHMVVGLVRLDSGTVSIDEHVLSNAPMHRRAQKGLVYLPQEPSVFRKLTVENNLHAIIELRRDLDKSQKKALAQQLLAEFNLQEISEVISERLSGGERRRLEIARALANQPRFLLLDEPFAGVDPISVDDIKVEIRKLATRQIGVLITDHNVRETLDICDRAYIVNEGRIIADGTAHDVLSDEVVQRVYLGQRFSI